MSWRADVKRESIVWWRLPVVVVSVSVRSRTKGGVQMGRTAMSRMASCHWRASAGMVGFLVELGARGSNASGQSNAAAVVDWCSALAGALGGDVVAVSVQESAAPEAGIGAAARLELAVSSKGNVSEFQRASGVHAESVVVEPSTARIDGATRQTVACSLLVSALLAEEVGRTRG